MKRLFYTVLMVMAVAACSNDAGRVTIKGQCASDSVYIFTSSAKGLEYAIAVDDGEYLFKAHIDKPEVAFISDSRDGRGSYRIGFFLEPGDIVITPAGEDDYDVTGSPANDAFASLIKTQREMNILQEKAFREGNQAVIDSLGEEYTRIGIQFTKDNMDNFAGLYILQEFGQYFEDEKIMEMLDRCTDDIKGSSEWISFKEKTGQVIDLKTNGYKDFKQLGLDRKSSISLKEVVETKGNKYVLLDFWASWCSPCMGEIPYLKAAYNKYHRKGFEIFGCSFDKKEDSWKSAIEKNGMNWIHVSSLDAWDNEASDIYGVNSIPANFLIDCSNGRIIATDLRGEELDAKLGELLK